MKLFFPLILLFTGSLSFMGCFGGSEKTPDQTSKKPPVALTQDKTSSPAAKVSRVALEVPPGYSQEATGAVLHNNLTAKDPAKRAHAIASLRFWGWKDSLDLIRAALKDSNPLVQKAAVEALASFKDTESVPQLYGTFQRARGKKRLQEAVLIAFREINDDKTISFIEGLLGKLDPQLSSIAVEVLRAIRPIRKPTGDSGRESLDAFTISGIIGRGKSQKVQAGGEFFGVGDSILGFEIKSIDSDNGIVSLAKSGKSFSKPIDVGEQDPVEKAIEATQGTEDRLVYEALMKLASYRDPRPSAELISLLEGDNSDEIKLGALFAIGLCGIENAIDSIRNMLSREKKTDFLILGIDALVRMGDENATDSLVSLAKHPNPWIRNAVVHGLGTLASNHGLSNIVAGLFDRYSFVRSNALHQLIQLSDLGLKGEIAKLLDSISYSEEITPDAQKFANFLGTLPVEEGEESSTDMWSKPGTGATIEKKKVSTDIYKPKFIILNMGSFGVKKLVTISEDGVSRRVHKGDYIDGNEVIEIDLDDELVHLKLPDGKVALIEQTDDSTPAAVFEIQ